jgi:phosphatidylserine/phosphatidylglycerophosphate/cardiolipin synthase-like enzyme
MNTLQKEIITDIRSAKQSLKIAVSWLTDPLIIDELILQSTNGKDVKVIVSGDDWNIIEFERIDKLQSKGATVNKKGSKEFNQNGFMHAKFMVIDNQIAREGSYNFTKNAQYQDNHFNRTSNAGILLRQFDEILAKSVDFFDDVNNPEEIRDNLAMLENEGAIPEEKLQRLAELKLKKSEEKVILQQKQIKEAEEAKMKAEEQSRRAIEATAILEAEKRKKEQEAVYALKEKRPPITQVPPTSYGK